MTRAPHRANTADQILDVAEELVQVRGFNGFSYADVAAELSVTNAALHYHFATKAALGRALIDRYSNRFRARLDEIDSSTRSATKKLAAYAEVYADVLQADRMCLCGMLAAEYATLPADMQEAVVAFFDANEAWLAGVLRPSSGRAAAADARAIISGLEGAMLVDRPYGDVARFRGTARRLLAGIAPGA